MQFKSNGNHTNAMEQEPGVKMIYKKHTHTHKYTQSASSHL